MDGVGVAGCYRICSGGSMSNELRTTWNTGENIYAVIYNSNAYVWHLAGNAFESFGPFTRDMDDYDIALTEQGTSGGYYSGDFDADIPSGKYLIVYYQRIGGTAANDDPPIAYDYGQWTGTVWLSLLDLLSGPGSTLVTLTVRTTSGVAIPNVLVWVSDQDDEDTSLVAPVVSDSSGQVQFYLDLNTAYYVFCSHSSYSFAAATFTPITGTVSFNLDVATVLSPSPEDEEPDTVLDVITEEKTCVQMIARVKQLVGRAVAGNTISIDQIILDALNDAQVAITRRCPHIMSLQTTNTTTILTVLSQYAYSIASVSPAIAHLMDVWILYGLETVQVTFLDMVTFDKRYPVVASESAACPDYYTQRGTQIEFNCPISSDYAGRYLRLNYCKWPTSFLSTTSTARSDLLKASQGLILYAWSETLRAIAKNNATMLQAATEKRQWFEDWLDGYSQYHDLQVELPMEI